MTSKFRFAMAASAALSCVALTGHAVPITFDSFGSLPQATFGGTGIPNDEVAAGSQFVFGDTTVTAALSATQRFNNPALTSDGAGTYFATPGSNTPPGTTIEGSTWNFNFYIEVDDPNGTLAVNDFQVDLLYDFDPAADNTAGDLGKIDITNSINAELLAAPPGTPAPTVVQDSQNLFFGFLANDIPGFIDAPVGTFDPNVNGEYTIALQVTDAGFPLETVAIKVVVPEPATMGLLGSAGLLMLRRRRG
ncbi:MAG: PEP-CTERM sorting domain-containing protein [Planctomycetota bacterium]